METNIIYEITSNTVAILVGYNLNNKPIILYKNEKYYEDLLIANNLVLDEAFLANEIITISQEVNLKFNNSLEFSNIYLSYPSFSLKAFSSNQSTNIISNESKVAALDIKNLFMMARKEYVPPQDTVIDVILDYFKNDKGQIYYKIPLNEETNFLTFHYKFYTTPTSLYNGLVNVFRKTQMPNIRFIPSSISIASYLKDNTNYPETYFLIENNEELTSVSMISKEKVFANNICFKSLNSLFNEISSTLTISFLEARNLVYKFGLDRNKYDYEVVIYEKDNVRITQKQLNTLLVNFFNEFLKNIGICVKDIIESLNTLGGEKIPFIFSGCILDIFNFKESLSSEYLNMFYFYNSNVIEAKESNFLSLLATLYSLEERTKIEEIEAKAESLKPRTITRGE